MFDTLKKLFAGNQDDLRAIAESGATILDVRTYQEFMSGHIPGAINIPVDQLSNNLSKLKDKNKPIITCCASGMRSASAKGYLKSQGYTAVYNGGGWMSLQGKIR